MLAPSDVNLLALNAVFARMFALRNRLCRAAQSADIAARLRLCQIHRARPFSAHQIGHILRLLGSIAVMGDGLNRPDRQHGQQIERHIGSAKVLQNIASERKGQALPAKFCR